MLILAHRGYHVELPENTLAAFDAALGQGADGVETDVQVTREGTPILFHDRLIRGRAVSELTHAELASLAGYEVPTLVDALDAFPEIFWNLEIKMPTDFEPILPILLQYREQRRLLVSSFWHPLAVKIARELEIDCGLLVAHRPWSVDALLSELPAVGSAIVWNYEGVDEELIDEARSSGIKSYVYGVQTLADHATVTGWKVTGLITDHPGRAKRIEVS